MITNRQLNCLSYWYPKIQGIVPTPKTTIIKTDLPLVRLLDGGPGVPEFEALVEEVATACDQMGYPAFLRTGHTSGKFEWKETCFIPDRESVGSHMLALVEFSELVDLIGLPYDTWVVREMLSTKPIGTAFRGMPVSREFRMFVRDNELLCAHPYWPQASFKNGVPEGYNEMCEMREGDFRTMGYLAVKCGKAVGGKWSVDVLETTNGWYVTDMALAEDSWHWPGCPIAQNEHID